jgi:hypothetical protein
MRTIMSPSQSAVRCEEQLWLLVPVLSLLVTA